MYDVDPFDYISINTRHTDILKLRHTYMYAKTDCFKNTVFNRFPVYFDRLPLHVRERLLFSLSCFLNNSKYYFTNSSWQVQFWLPVFFLFFLCAWLCWVMTCTLPVPSDCLVRVFLMSWVLLQLATLKVTRRHYLVWSLPSGYSLFFILLLCQFLRCRLCAGRQLARSVCSFWCCNWFIF